MKPPKLDPHTKSIQNWDERRDLIILPNKDEAVHFSVKHFLQIAKKAIQEDGKFTVALSGGTTPKAIYEKLAQHKSDLDWSKVWLFFSDERCVPLTSEDSNYHMAMTAGFLQLPIPKHQIFPMKTVGDISKTEEEYEKIIEKYVGPDLFDLVMLGIGEDGHVASLFPNTAALEIEKRAVAANFVPQKHAWRMTLTFDCINNSSQIALYVLGDAKKEIVKKILLPSSKQEILPAERIGTEQQKALWVLDIDAAEGLFK